MTPIIKFDHEVTPEQAERVREAWYRWRNDPSQPLILGRGASLIDLDAPPVGVVVPSQEMLNERLNELVRWVLIEAILLTIVIAVFAGLLILRWVS